MEKSSFNSFVLCIGSCSSRQLRERHLPRCPNHHRRRYQWYCTVDVVQTVRQYCDCRFGMAQHKTPEEDEGGGTCRHERNHQQGTKLKSSNVDDVDEDNDSVVAAAAPLQIQITIKLNFYFMHHLLFRQGN